MLSICKKVSSVFGASLLAVALSGCEQEGPTEKAGRDIDQAVEQFGETLEKEKDGPIEQAGERIDEVVREADEAMRQAGEKIKGKSEE